ncbi:MAG: sulfatase-like hydrolase/transferase, partial [Bacteroidetes bacterium]|nr:sulfatase-like hydrolase/transferase [Bacteroidota bacterium]
MVPINKRVLKILALVCLVSACKNNSYDPELMRPNILFIITDDQSWEHLGSYGDEAVRTPAIDKLATEGVRFENAYTAAPSCSPSRAGILTGQDVYRLREGGVLTGFLRNEYVVFPE